MPWIGSFAHKKTRNNLSIHQSDGWGPGSVPNRKVACLIKRQNNTAQEALYLDMSPYMVGCSAVWYVAARVFSAWRKKHVSHCGCFRAVISANRRLSQYVMYRIQWNVVLRHAQSNFRQIFWVFIAFNKRGDVMALWLCVPVLHSWKVLRP